MEFSGRCMSLKTPETRKLNRATRRVFFRQDAQLGMRWNHRRLGRQDCKRTPSHIHSFYLKMHSERPVEDSRTMPVGFVRPALIWSS